MFAMATIKAIIKVYMVTMATNELYIVAMATLEATIEIHMGPSNMTTQLPLRGSF